MQCIREQSVYFASERATNDYSHVHLMSTFILLGVVLL
jgi:hypothetical protein